jgi:hypothetical protein
MCFSAQASFIAGATLSSIGLFLISKYRTSKLYPLAFAPLAFGIQQALEGGVWVTLNKGDVISILHTLCVYGFTFFAGIFWPLATSSTLYYLEQNTLRKKMLAFTVTCGLIVAIMSAFTLIKMNITANALNHHIVYTIRSPFFDTTMMYYWYKVGLILYCIATIGALFISSIPYAWILGVLTTLGFIIAHLFYYFAFGSVWCFFAALISGCVWYIFSSNRSL